MLERERAIRRGDGTWECGSTIVAVSQSHTPIDASAGGDRTDAFVCPDGTLHLCVLDACRHGIVAERAATFASDALRVVLCGGASPREALVAIERLVLHLERGDRSLLTALVVSIDPLARSLTYASAGHVDALLLNESAHHHLQPTGPMLGLGRAGDLAESRIALAHARSLVIATDGITESRAARFGGMELGTAGLTAMARGLATRAGGLSAARLMVDARRRAGGAFRDDAAVLVAEFASIAR